MQWLPTDPLPPGTVTHDVDPRRLREGYRLPLAAKVDFLPYAARKTRTHSAA